jgi:hypothetical protein
VSRRMLNAADVQIDREPRGRPPRSKGPSVFAGST